MVENIGEPLVIDLTVFVAILHLMVYATQVYTYSGFMVSHDDITAAMALADHT